jgi:hypothetical protein
VIRTRRTRLAEERSGDVRRGEERTGEVPTRFWWRKLRARKHLEDQGESY